MKLATPAFSVQQDLTSTQSKFTQYTTEMLLTATYLLCCTFMFRNNILTPGLTISSHRVYMGSAGGRLCSEQQNRNSKELR